MIQIIAFVIEIIDFPIDGRILVGGITDAAVPYDVGIVAVIRIIPARTCRHIDRSLPFLTVIGNTGMIAVGLIIRLVKDQSLSAVCPRTDIGIAGSPVPMIIDFLLPRHFQAPFILFIEIFCFMGCDAAVPADDIAQMAMENTGFEVRFGMNLILESQRLRIAFFRLQVFFSPRRARHIELVVEPRRRKDAAPGSVDVEGVTGLIIHGQARCPMHAKGTVIVDPQSRRHGPLAEYQGIFGIDGPVMPFFVYIMSLVIGPHVLCPLGAGRYMLMGSELPVVLPFYALRPGQEMIGPERALIIVEIAEKSRLGRTGMEIICQTVIVDQSFNYLIIAEIPAWQAFFPQVPGQGAGI